MLHLPFSGSRSISPGQHADAVLLGALARSVERLVQVLTAHLVRPGLHARLLEQSALADLLLQPIAAAVALVVGGKRVIEAGDRVEVEQVASDQHVERELELALVDDLSAARDLLRCLVVANDGAVAVGRDVDAVDEAAQLEVAEVERARIVLVLFAEPEAALEKIRLGAKGDLPPRLVLEELLDLDLHPGDRDAPLGVQPALRALGDELVQELAETCLPALQIRLPWDGVSRRRLRVEPLQGLVDEPAEPERVRSRLQPPR